MFGAFTGINYPAVTRKAFSKFNEDMKSITEERSKPIDLNKKVKNKPETDTKAYHSHTGMAPQYSGHARGN